VCAPSDHGMLTHRRLLGTLFHPQLPTFSFKFIVTVTCDTASTVSPCACCTASSIPQLSRRYLHLKRSLLCTALHGTLTARLRTRATRFGITFASSQTDLSSRFTTYPHSRPPRPPTTILRPRALQSPSPTPISTHRQLTATYLLSDESAVSHQRKTAREETHRAAE